MAKYHTTGFWFLLLLLAVNPVQGQESCLMRVFNHYCLGGDVNQTLQQTPQPVHQQREGERFGLIYQQQRDQVYVMAFRDRIYKILQTQNPGSYSKYKGLRNQLNKKYGYDQDQSNLPKHVQNTPSIIGSIRRGEGEIRHLWKVAGQPWQVELSWTRELGLSVAYIIESLDKQQAAEQTGL